MRLLYLQQLIFHLLVQFLLIVALYDESSSEKSEWWEVEKTNDKLFAPYKNSQILLRHSDLDESGLHSCYSYKIVEKKLLLSQGTFCYPSSNTSFFY